MNEGARQANIEIRHREIVDRLDQIIDALTPAPPEPTVYVEHRLYSRDGRAHGPDDPMFCACGEPWPCLAAPSGSALDVERLARALASPSVDEAWRKPYGLAIDTARAIAAAYRATEEGAT